MKKRILHMAITAVSMSTVLTMSNVHANENIDKKLFLFKDLSSYQEKIKTDIKDSYIIEMPNTTVLKSINYQLMSDSKRVFLDNAKIIPKSEKNIFIINQGKLVQINDKPATTLISYGPDFIKTKNQDNKHAFVRYTPKEKINSMTFQRDIDSQSHILEIKPNKDIEDAEINVSYSVGKLNWQPKYILNVTDDNVNLDYIIEIDNQTNKNFNDVNLAISTDSIQRIYKDYTNGIEDYIFTVFNTVVQPTPPIEAYGRYNKMEMAMSMDSMSEKSSRVVSKMGKESIVFDQKVNIDSNSKSLIEYDVDNKFEYNKNNKISLMATKKEIINNPVYSIEVIRKNDIDSMKLVPGVISVYADKDIYNGQLLNEIRVGKVNKNQNINLNMGENNDIKVISKLNSESEIIIYTERLSNKNNSDININVHSTNERAAIKRDYDVYGNKIVLKEISMKINSKNVKSNEDLTIESYGNSFFVEEKDVNYVKSELMELSKLSKESHMSEKQKMESISRIQKDFGSKNMEFNESELKNGINKVVYKLEVTHKTYLERVSK